MMLSVPESWFGLAQHTVLVTVSSSSSKSSTDGSSLGWLLVSRGESARVWSGWGSCSQGDGFGDDGRGQARWWGHYPAPHTAIGHAMAESGGAGLGGVALRNHLVDEGGGPDDEQAGSDQCREVITTPHQPPRELPKGKALMFFRHPLPFPPSSPSLCSVAEWMLERGFCWLYGKGGGFIMGP